MADTKLLTEEQIRIEVVNPEVKKSSNILKGTYVAFTIRTAPFGWSVLRRYSDFEWLHARLTNRFPSYYVRKKIF